MLIGYTKPIPTGEEIAWIARRLNYFEISVVRSVRDEDIPKALELQMSTHLNGIFETLTEAIRCLACQFQELKYKLKDVSRR